MVALLFVMVLLSIRPILPHPGVIIVLYYTFPGLKLHSLMDGKQKKGDNHRIFKMKKTL